MEPELLAPLLIESVGFLQRDARALTGNQWDAEDLASETLLRAWRFAGSLQSGEPASVRAWLRRIQRNLFNDCLRHKTRELCRKLPPVDAEPVDPPDPVNRFGEVDAVEEALYNLKLVGFVACDRTRRIYDGLCQYVLERQDELQPALYAELARALGIRPGYLKNQLVVIKKYADMIALRSQGFSKLNEYADAFTHLADSQRWVTVDMSALATSFRNWADDHPCGRLIANPGGTRVFVYDMDRLVGGALDRARKALLTHVQCGIRVGLVDIQKVPVESRLDMGYFANMAFNYGHFYPLDENDDCVRYNLASSKNERIFVETIRAKVAGVLDVAEVVMTRPEEVTEYCHQ